MSSDQSKIAFIPIGYTGIRADWFKFRASCSDWPDSLLRVRLCPVGVCDIEMKLPNFSSILFALALLLIRYLQRHRKRLQQETVRVVYKKGSTGIKDKSWLIQQIISHCPSIRNPKYIPPTLFSGSWGNMILSFMKENLYEILFYSKSKFRKQIHVLPDGGRTAYVWLKADDALPSTAPIVFILHTLAAQIKHLQILMDYCIRRGWRPCALIRRGHLEDEPLSRPCFNIVGDPEDTHSQVNAHAHEHGSHLEA